ncbi:MAG: 3-hydroxyacyl-CoA dehydrogenase NAD-binding domain-containing protein [Thermoanaerobaculum sp.]|nr:3-hydroxyacyl-CoA dehydrogenase NAD-binding domain-containing protein [Thermoanaerobaculum sp.]MDW7967039.1 3-hydroxyacyl-CoA dehydrogenase NAD-binding domain-containing protein [Thermoanaerobaculum sp.]
MHQPIGKVAVLGAGVMGSGIAAHLANAGIPSLLLDIVPSYTAEDEKAGLRPQDRAFRNKLALQALENIKKSKPALLYSQRFLPLIQVGNFEDDWHRLSQCDWIVEAVVERLDIKQQLFARVEQVWRPGSIVSSNTSGLPIRKMVEGRSLEFRKHFLVTHFFNPVRYMRLLELVAGEDTDPEVVRRMADFGRFRLGKGIVFGKDTPNFVGNRIGVFALMATLHAMMEMDYQVDEVDAITGPAMGHPKSASFGTVDLVGLDTMLHVVRTLREDLPQDEGQRYFQMPQFVTQMVEQGLLGRKAGAGFFKREQSAGGEKQDLVLDWKNLTYRPKQRYDYPALKATKDIHDPGARIRALVESDDRAGRFAWRVLRDTLAYTSRRLFEIADTIVDIDNALKWGFNWELGPFETWDALGVRETVERMNAEGVQPAPWVEEMLAAGVSSFYRAGTLRREYWDPAKRAYLPEPRPESFLVLSELKRTRRIVFENPGASLVDLGDGIACVEFHSAAQPKLNPIDDQIMEVMHKALELGAKEFRGLVIHHQGEQFCAGANLLMILEGAMSQAWKAIDEMVRKFQAITLGMRYAPIPVVTAPFGFTFGGGAEITMGGDRVCALAETYIGLVEVGVGLVPAGAGHVFMLERVLEGIDEPILDNLPFIRKAFETIALAKVATSAEEARELKYLRPCDHVELNRDQQLWTAKRMAIALAEQGYRPPLPRTFHLPGRSGIATLRVILHNLKLTHNISSHDEKIATHIATILCGGDTTIHNPVSEQTILDLEREAFLSLCGEPKTQERIKYMLLNNKPLRN